MNRPPGEAPRDSLSNSRASTTDYDLIFKEQRRVMSRATSLSSDPSHRDSESDMVYPTEFGIDESWRNEN